MACEQSEVMQDIRFKSRDDINALRQVKKSDAYNAKRLYLSEISDDYQEITVDQVRQLALDMKRNPGKDLKTICKLKKALSQDGPEKETFLKVDGALHVLVGLLASHNSTVQLESAGCLVNLLTGSHKMIKPVVREATPYLVSFLSGSSKSMQELCAWAIGNICADCSDCCSVLRAHTFLPPLISLLQSSHADVVYSSLFALKNYMRELPEGWGEILHLGLETHLSRLLNTPISDDVLTEAANILFYLTASEIRTDDLINCGCIGFARDQLCAVVLSSQKDDEVHLTLEKCRAVTFLVRSLAEICAEKAEAAHLLLQLPHFVLVVNLLISCNFCHVQKETLWLIGNVASHALPELPVLLESELLIKSLVRKLFGPPEIVQQSLYCLCNMAFHQNAQFLNLTATFANDNVFYTLLCSSNCEIIAHTLLLISFLIRSNNELFCNSLKKIHETICNLSYCNDEQIKVMAMEFLTILNV